MKNGTMKVAELGNAKNFGEAKIWEIFQGLEHTEKIRSILERIKKNAAGRTIENLPTASAVGRFLCAVLCNIV